MLDRLFTGFIYLILLIYLIYLTSPPHRDLKLENILLETGNNIKIVDFGSTRKFKKGFKI